MCPWSYLGKARLRRALHRAKTNAQIEWIPFELYAHDGAHRVQKEAILGHGGLPQVYAQLHELAARENLIILHPQYEASTRRALTGFLYAQRRRAEEKYMDLVYEQVFEHTANISSLPVLGRIAIKLGWDPVEFNAFIENPRNQNEVARLSASARAEGVRGIPTYLINHLPVTGALPVNDLVGVLHSLRGNALPAFLLPEKKTGKKGAQFRSRKPRPIAKKGKTHSTAGKKKKR